MARETLVDFNVLPRATRERFADSTSDAPSLAPIFAAPHSTGAAIFWWVVLGLNCLGGVYFLAAEGFGTLNTYEDMVQSPTLIPVYFGTLFLLAAAGLGIAFQLKRRDALPFRAGRYLFPLDFVDARSRQLRIIPLSELADFQAVHHHTNGAYTHTAFTFKFANGASEEFSVRNREDAETRLQNLQQARAAFAKALEAQDADTIHRLDLFFDVRLKGGFEKFQEKAPSDFSGGLLALELPRVIEKRWLLALAAGVVLGPGVWLVRNLVSDSLAFSAARLENSGGAYHAYLRTGWLHVAEAKELGWQANFKTCEEQDTEHCWQEFVSRWSESPRLKEAKEDRQPRAALKEASGTVSGVRAFRQRYPSSVVDEQAKARIHELFTESLAEFAKQASTENPELVPFVGKLLAHLEATETSNVLVRFRREQSASLEVADRILSQALTEEGKPMAKASPYFDEESTRPLENDIAEALGNAFKAIFPADVLTLSKGPGLPEKQDAAQVTTPELGIVYTVGWSGDAYRSENGGRQFVGIEFNFDAGMVVPKERPLNFSFTVHPPERFSVQYTRYLARMGSLDTSGPDDGAVYKIMALRAFDELGDKLREVFFRPDSAAFMAGRIEGLDDEEEEAAPPPPPKKKASPKKGSGGKKATGTASATPP